MSAASFQRYRVTFTVWSDYDIIVEALSRDDAIRKVKRIYHTNGLGDDSFAPSGSEAGLWQAVQLVAEVQR